MVLKPARIKIRALPSMKNAQNSANPDGNAGNMTFDTIQSSAYSTSRWQLLNAIKLDIKVPGNASLAAGDVVNVRFPHPSQSLVVLNLTKCIRASILYLV